MANAQYEGDLCLQIEKQTQFHMENQDIHLICARYLPSDHRIWDCSAVFSHNESYLLYKTMRKNSVCEIQFFQE